MKKIISLVLAILMVGALAGCGTDRIMYSSTNLNNYVNVPDYKGIKIDTKSDEYKEAYDECIADDIENNSLYVEKTEGKVADGDVANIDYVGKKDGVAFEGGTAENHDLEIGSGSFIDGFESGLIGVEIGSTVDLNLTFPEDYGNEELNGAAVVFTVTVNYVKTDESLKPEEYFKKLGFKSLKKYEEDVKDRAIKTILFNTIEEGSEVIDYPKKDVEFLTKVTLENLEKRLKESYDIGLDEYITQNGMTKDTFEDSLLEQEIYPLMDQTMPIYYILDKEGANVTQKDIDKTLEEIIEGYDDPTVTAQDLIDYYGDYYIECTVANEKAMKIVRKYAKIK